VVNPSDAGGYPTLPDINSRLVTITFSSDGTRIVAGLENGGVLQWDAESGALIGGPLLRGPIRLRGGVFEFDRVEVLAVAYSSDGTRIVAGNANGTVWQWNAENGAPIIGIEPATIAMMVGSPNIPDPFVSVHAKVMSLAYSLDGKHILAGTSDGTVIRLNAETGETIDDMHLSTALSSDSNTAVTSLAYSPDGAEILAGTAGGLVFRWPDENGAPIRDLRYREVFNVTSLAYNPHGTAIVTGLADGTVVQWDAVTGVISSIQFLDGAPLPAITFNPSTKTDASSAAASQVTSVAYSADGTRIAVGTANGAVWQLDAVNELLGGTLLGSLNSVLSVAYSPDGTRVFAVDYDGSVQVWRAASVMPPLLAILLCIAAGINGIVCWRVWGFSTPEPDERAPALSSDKPIQTEDNASEAQKDIVERISEFVRNPDASAPLTFAITGKWGTGKSSLMRLIQKDLRKCNAPCIWFNAWHHQNETHLFASLMESIRRDAVIANPLSFRQFASNLDFRLNLVRVRFHDRPVSVFVASLLLTALLVFFVWALIVALLLQAAGTLAYSLASLMSFMALFVSRFNPLKGFGIAPASLLQTSRRWIQIPRFADRLSFRDQFGRAFGEVCSAFGSRRLVIIIDDLDRCKPDQVVEILEAVNFLTSNGDCFVFLGIDEHQVNHAVGLHYSDIAEQMRIHKQADHEDGGDGGIKPRAPSVLGEGERMAARQSYAKHYIQKLINISIPVPVADAKTPSKIAEGTQ